MLTLLVTIIDSRLEAMRVLSIAGLQIEATGIATSAYIHKVEQTESRHLLKVFCKGCFAMNQTFDFMKITKPETNVKSHILMDCGGHLKVLIHFKVQN